MSLTDSNNDNKNDKNNHDLRGQRLSIPDLRPAFATWKRGVNPLHARVRPAVDARLEPLIEDTRALAKVRLGDIGLFAAGCVSPRCWKPTYQPAYRPLTSC